MKWIKKILITLLILVLLLFALATWYKNTFSMDPVTGYTVKSDEMPKSMLIATQGSMFKDAITKGIIDEYANDSIHVNVIDVLKIGKENTSNYDVMVLIHTWENWKAPKEVEDFVLALSEVDKTKTVVLTTSGKGDSKMDNLDAITGESDLENSQEFLEEIISKIEAVLNAPQ
ncbi:hypothetical protein [Flagellimonas allohymeniacidonis]|uniref:Flavodoxin-like domain-containing protein n=1 Tax=Flagellimonas allohymeniacidonis TaxID=2517819 RepID=A0A4Q8QFF8_9FLAO|nr:hypothetical protein [Allomuricauda hymeniacidonis]TAI48427.1 hypothetical protein EW142_01070 [Allomuricauda hymeniacidonis]